MNANTMSFWSWTLGMGIGLLLLAAGQQQLANAMIGTQCSLPYSRLSSRFRPSNYILEINLALDMNTFSGSVMIEFDILRLERKKPKQFHRNGMEADRDPNHNKKIYFNAVGLDIRELKFKQGDKWISLSTICYDKTSQFAEIKLPRPFKIGHASLYLSFSGRVNGEARGLFRSVIDPAKTTLATHFKPNHARRMFPCFDELEFKATFQLTVKHPTGSIALSNTKYSEPPEVDGYFTKTSFKTTPRMSSYLLGLAVGEYEPIEGTSLIYGQAITLYAPRGWAGQASGMLAKAVEAYDKVTDFFLSTEQLLEKIDIVAVNMEPIAMENWGLITMRWDYLFAAAMETTPNHSIRAFIVLMTQMIHQRLGNLVTMIWWEDLWLQEGIAAHLANELIAEMPGTDYELYALVDTTFSAMNDDDDYQRRKPIKDVNHKTAEELVGSFDSFSYKKSEAIVRMFAAFVGRENFKLTILDFLKMNRRDGLANAASWWYKFKLVGTATLYDKMQVAFLQWIEQVGYPTIHVFLINARTLKVSQLPQYANGQFWFVPIVCEFHGGSYDVFRTEFLLHESKELPLPRWFDTRSQSHWFTLNPKYKGYYHVIYGDDQQLQVKSYAIALGQMPVADRMQLLSDSLASAKRTGNTRDIETMLTLLGQYGESEHGVVLLWTRILTELHDSGKFPSNYLELVTNFMVNYYTRNGGLSQEVDSNALKQYVRGQVVEYLMGKLNNYDVKCGAYVLMVGKGELPPFLRHVYKYLPEPM